MVAKRVSGVGVPRMHGVLCRRILISSVPRDSPYQLDFLTEVMHQGYVEYASITNVSTAPKITFNRIIQVCVSNLSIVVCQ